MTLQHQHLRRPDEPLPPFISAAALRREIFQALRPPRRVSVSEAAARHRRINNPGAYVGPWKNDKTPWLVEPMDRALSRSIDELYFVGPSQISAKTELMLNIIAHGIKYRPSDVLMIQPTNRLAIDFAQRRIDRGLIGTSPDLARELGPSRSDQKALTKLFRNGLMLTIAWPSENELASRPVPMVMVDERDRLPDDIGGEGDPIALGRNRKKTFGANGALVCVSSPSRQDYSGIMPHYYEGDQNLWHWPCPDCGDYFAPGFDQDRRPTFDHLRWAADATPAEARETVYVACPSCGAAIAESHKARMNDRGVWLPRGMTITPDGSIRGDRPVTRIASYWFCGLASNLGSWGDLAHDHVAAEIHFDKTADEDKLKTVINTGYGFPYRSRLEGRPPPEPDELGERCDDYRLGTVPPGPAFLTAAVDVQGNRFEVSVKGWSRESESWLIDRFAIRQLDDGRTDIDPARYPEHWRILLDKVIKRTYPLVADAELVLPIANTAIDMQGIEGVTENARGFWRYARARKVGDLQLTLVRGANTVNAPALPRSTFETDDRNRRRPNASKFFTIGVHAIKNTVANRLHRTDPGPGYMHYPADTPERYFEELAGERKLKGTWHRTGANESFDLEVYNIAAFLRLRIDRIDWRRPPWWAVPKRIAAAVETSAPSPAPGAASPAGVRRPRPAPPRRRGGFVNSWKT